MATDMMGLFGPTPEELQQQRMTGLRNDAVSYAKMNPFEQATAGIYQGAGMLTDVGARAFGGVNPQEQAAQRTQAIMGQGDTDLTTSKGLLAKADQFRKAGDTRTALTLTLKGKELEKQEQAAALASRKQDFQEQEMLELKKQQLQQQADLAREKLEQQGREAERRSEDTRLGIEARERATQEANAIKLQIAQMTAAMTRMGLDIKAAAADKPNKALTQAGKLRQDLESGAIDQSTYDAEIAALPGGKMQTAKETAATGALSHLDNVERNLIKLYDPKTQKLTDPATALFGSKMNQFRGSFTLGQSSVDALTSLTALKDQVMLSNLQEAKARVGQSFGSMQLKEWDKFVNQLVSLDRAQSEESAAANMKDILNFIQTKRPVLQAALGGGSTPPKITPDQFNAQWATLPKGKSLVGPDGKTYTKK